MNNLRGGVLTFPLIALEKQEQAATLLPAQAGTQSTLKIRNQISGLAWSNTSGTSHHILESQQDHPSFETARIFRSILPAISKQPIWHPMPSKEKWSAEPNYNARRQSRAPKDRRHSDTVHESEGRGRDGTTGNIDRINCKKETIQAKTAQGLHREMLRGSWGG